MRVLLVISLLLWWPVGAQAAKVFGTEEETGSLGWQVYSTHTVYCPAQVELAIFQAYVIHMRANDEDAFLVFKFDHPETLECAMITLQVQQKPTSVRVFQDGLVTFHIIWIQNAISGTGGWSVLQEVSNLPAGRR